MARREQDDLRGQLNAIADRDGASIVAIAFLMDADPNELRDFLQGAGHDATGMAARVRRFIADRNARWNRIINDKSGEAREAAKREHSAELTEVLKGLTEWAPDEVQGRAETARLVGLMHLNALQRLFQLCDEPGNCWRCGANLRPLPAEVDIQIAANERAAGWQAWPPEIYRQKLQAVMQIGDRIVGIRAGAIVLRRFDGTLLEVNRWDG